MYIALIFYMSSHPAPAPVRAVPIYYDIKIVHIIEYALLSLLLFFGFYRTTKIPILWMCIYSVALTYIYGLTDELHQVFVPMRSAKIEDTIANLIGASIMQTLLFLRNPIKK